MTSVGKEEVGVGRVCQQALCDPGRAPQMLSEGVLT